MRISGKKFSVWIRQRFPTCYVQDFYHVMLTCLLSYVFCSWEYIRSLAWTDEKYTNHHFLWWKNFSLSLADHSLCERNDFIDCVITSCACSNNCNWKWDSNSCLIREWIISMYWTHRISSCHTYLCTLHHLLKLGMCLNTVSGRRGVVTSTHINILTYS